MIWAVDPFHENAKTQLHALQAFLKMGRYPGASIQPVAVVHSGSFDPVSLTFPDNWHALASAALSNVIDALENVAGLIHSPIRILRVDKPRLSVSVEALTHFAVEENASLILVSSSARRGVDRLFLGSFAETLVLRSPVPVFVVNPTAKTHQRMTTLLYPTDFSVASRKGFDRALSISRSFGMQVMIFHKVRLPFSNPRVGVTLPKVSRESLRDLKSEVTQTAATWAKRGELSGVRTKFHIDVQGGSPLEAIAKMSRRLGGKAMIGMTSQSGPVASTILGSLTRQVLRSVTCPVLVIHADQPSLARKVLLESRSLGYAYSAHPLMT